MNHDRLFKELLRTFFLEFLEAFLPEILEFLDPLSIEFLDKEIFTDIAGGERHEVDLLVKVRFKGRPTFFLIHVESQATAEPDFAARIFFYFARIHESHRLPIFPIAILSYDAPSRPEPDRYEVGFPQQPVLSFRFRTIQLNRLNWKEFLRKPNPVAAALMTKMRLAPEDRPKVALECLRMIATLKLDPARQTIIRTFMYSYLKLSAEELVAYNRELDQISPKEKEAVMEILNPWEQQGIRIGEERGLRRGETAVILRQLARRFGTLSDEVREQIGGLPLESLEQLADAVLDFGSLPDVHTWLANRDGKA